MTSANCHSSTTDEVSLDLFFASRLALRPHFHPQFHLRLLRHHPIELIIIIIVISAIVIPKPWPTLCYGWRVGVVQSNVSVTASAVTAPAAPDQ